MAQVVLIIIVMLTGTGVGHVSVTEHQFTSMENCIAARDQVTDVPFRFGSEVRAFCTKK